MPEYDVVVVGAGASGLRAAIAAKKAGASVAVVTKVHPLRTNSGLSPGGLNAPLGPDDSPEKFAQDTMTAGAGLCVTDAVRILAEEAAREVVWLDRVGVPFNRDASGKLDRRRLGCSSTARACYADDRTGFIVLQVLHEQFQRAQIPSFEERFVTSLVVEDGACRGVIALSMRSGQLETFTAGAVVLATGGLTRLYRPCTASMGTTGDGQSLAYGAGVPLMDMEMIQFHPTVFSGRQTLLISEAAIAAGALLVNEEGDTIVDAKNLPRDQIALEVYRATRNGGGPAYLDLRPVDKDRLVSRFPQTLELVRLLAGLDATKDRVPVSPVAHRPMGGIGTDSSGATSMTGLFAVGECACSGVNGAGRLAGNTLTEALVFGNRVGAAAAQAGAGQRKSVAAPSSEEERRLREITSGGSSGDSPGLLQIDLGAVMNSHVGVVRTESGLKEARAKIQTLKERYRKLRVNNTSKVYNYALTNYLELGSLLELAEAVTLAATARTESRGSHRREDFPEKDDAHWGAHTVVQLSAGAAKAEKRPLT